MIVGDAETAQHGWSWAFRMLWKEGAPRCPLKIADTILFNDGHPVRWLFTSKEGFVMKRTSSKTTLGSIRTHLIEVSLSNPKNRGGYVAVVRNAAVGAEPVRAQVIDRSRLEGSFQPGANLSSVLALQAYVHAKGGAATRYRCEYALDRNGRAFFRVHKLVYMGSGVVRGEALVERRPDDASAARAGGSTAFVLKSTMGALNRQASAATATLVRCLERASRRLVLRCDADFVCDADDADEQQLVFIGTADVVTTARAEGGRGGGGGTALPTSRAAEALLGPGASAARGPSSLSHAGGASGALRGECPGDFCDGFAEAEGQGLGGRGRVDGRALFASTQIWLLDEPTLGAGSLTPPFTGSRGDAQYQLTNKSILQARLEREAAALADPEARRALMAKSASLLPAASYYRAVRVCARCYAAYTRMDMQRAQMAGLDAPGKDGRGAGGLGAGGFGSLATLRGGASSRTPLRTSAGGARAASARELTVSAAQRQRETRGRAASVAELRRPASSGTLGGASALLPATSHEWSVRKVAAFSQLIRDPLPHERTPPERLPTDRPREGTLGEGMPPYRRRQLAEEQAAQIAAELAARYDPATEPPPRAAAARLDAAAHRATLQPRAAASSPAFFGAQTERETSARQALLKARGPASATAVDPAQAQGEAAADGEQRPLSGTSAQLTARSHGSQLAQLSRAASAARLSTAPARAGLRSAARSAPGSAAAAASVPPFARGESLLLGQHGGRFEIEDGVSVPYALLGSAAGAAQGAQGTRVDVLILPDFFESADAYAEPLVRPLLARAAGACVRMLLVNLPGQAHSRFETTPAGTSSGGAQVARGASHAAGSRSKGGGGGGGSGGGGGAVFNNEYCARVLAALLRRLRHARAFATPEASVVIFGAGNGANVATLLCADGGLRAELRVRSLVLCNPFAFVDHHLEMVLHNWQTAGALEAQSSRKAGSDLHLLLFSHLLFSERYLARVTMNGALDQLKASPNPMTLDGRMALCQGALAHRDLRELLPKLQLPVVVVQGSQNLLVRPEHAQPYVSALCDGARASTLRELAERGHGVSVVRVNAGHLLLHETPALLVRLLTAAIDESWAAVDSELLTHLAPPTPPAPTADSATW